MLCRGRFSLFFVPCPTKTKELPWHLWTQASRALGEAKPPWPKSLCGPLEKKPCQRITPTVLSWTKLSFWNQTQRKVLQVENERKEKQLDCKTLKLRAHSAAKSQKTGWIGTFNTQMIYCSPPWNWILEEKKKKWRKLEIAATSKN